MIDITPIKKQKEIYLKSIFSANEFSSWTSSNDTILIRSQPRELTLSEKETERGSVGYEVAACQVSKVRRRVGEGRAFVRKGSGVGLDGSRGVAMSWSPALVCRAIQHMRAWT